MFISLYSGPGCWVVVPVGMKPTTAAVIHGPLAFEGTIRSHLLPTEVWSRIWSEWGQASYASVSGKLGQVLLEAGRVHSGTLTPPFTEAWSGDAAATDDATPVTPQG